MPTVPALLIAALPGIAALLVALLNIRAQRRGAREGRRSALVQRYQEPLARAAYDLQSRVWNVLSKGLLQRYATDRTSRGWRYTCDSTLWLFAQYFGWVEVMRREVQFIPPERRIDRGLPAALAAVAHVLSTHERWANQSFQVFRAEQRAMGEVMIVRGYGTDGAPRASCMGYWRFLAQLAEETSPVAQAYADLRADIVAAAGGSLHGRERLLALQHALIDLVDVLDPEQLRFPGARDKAVDPAHSPG